MAPVNQTHLAGNLNMAVLCALIPESPNSAWRLGYLRYAQRWQSSRPYHVCSDSRATNRGSFAQTLLRNEPTRAMGIKEQ